MATVSNQHVSMRGPVRKEVVRLTDVSDTETFETTMQNPQFGYAIINSDGGSNAFAINLDISGRTVTFNSSILISSEVTATVYGF